MVLLFWIPGSFAFHRCFVERGHISTKVRAFEMSSVPTSGGNAARPNEGPEQNRLIGYFARHEGPVFKLSADPW